MMDKPIVDFTEKYNKKQAEQSKEQTTRACQLFVSVTLAKIELITGQRPYDVDIVGRICRCFDQANDEFLANDELMGKYGSDEDTPSIQLFLVNHLIDRTIELFFGEDFQADKL